MGGEDVSRTHARQHQQLRRVEGAAGEDHLAARVGLALLAWRSARTRVRRIQPLALQVFDADRAFALVEQHARGERVELDRQPIRMPFAHVEQPLARTEPPVVLRRQRRIARADLVLRDDVPVVRIAETLEARQRRHADFLEGVAERARDHPPDLVVANRFVRRRLFRRQPAGIAVAARVEAEPAPEPLERTMAAILDPFEVRAHVVGAPRRVAGQIGELIPVGVGRIDEDHRVVGGAAAKRAGARVPHTLLGRHVIRILLFLRGVLVVVNEEVPPHRLVLGGERMKRGHVVVGRFRIAAGFDDEDRISRFDEPRRDGPASRPRSDDDVIGGRCRW